MITDNEKVDAKDHLESETIDEHEKRENSESLQDEGIATASDSDAGELEDIDTQAQDIEEEQLRLKFEEVTQQYLLARAEAENIRKRADIEISNARKFALESFVRELLSVKDSLDLYAKGLIKPMISKISNFEGAESLHKDIEESSIVGRAGLII